MRLPLLASVLIALAIALVTALRLDGASDLFGYDFRLLWLAGRVWSGGASPYGPAYDTEYITAFGEEAAPSHFFVYPPYWILITAPIARLEFPTAAWVWTIGNLACLAAGSAALAFGVLKRGVSDPTPWFLAFFAFAASHQGTSFTLLVGQTSSIVFLATCLFLWGYSERKSVPLSLGLILFSLKPNLGLIPIGLVAARAYSFELRRFQPWALKALGWVCGFCGLGLALAAIIEGGLSTVQGFLVNVKRYGQPGIEANAPFNMTSPSQVTVTFFDFAIPVPVLLLLAIVLTVWLVRTSTFHAKAAYAAMASVFFFIPQHNYDLVTTAALAPLVLAPERAKAALVAVSLVLLHRCSNIELGFNEKTWFAGTLTATIATAVLLVSVALIRRPPPFHEDPSTR